MSVTVLGLVGGVLGGDNDDRASTASTTQPRVDGVDPVETFFLRLVSYRPLAGLA